MVCATFANYVVCYIHFLSSHRVQYLLNFNVPLTAMLKDDGFPGTFSEQLRGMEDSDEEMQLVNDLASLDSELKQAGCPCDENLYLHIFHQLLL